VRKAGAVVVAAGRSTRMGRAVAKPFLRLGRRTILGWSLVAFERSRDIGGVVVVVAREHLGRARRIARRFARVTAVVEGGERRQDSVRRGLEALAPGLDPVLVHDAARPLVTPALIAATAAAARRSGAAIAAHAVVDTVKEARAGRVVRTLDRGVLWAAETPQAVRRAWLEEGLSRAEREGAIVTDEAMLVERSGRAVRLVASLEPNLKVTTPSDLAVARALLAARRR
jgi:2-C-methyl-D-erythritol 4-phosphate cytidylyltransferase